MSRRMWARALRRILADDALRRSAGRPGRAATPGRCPGTPPSTGLLASYRAGAGDPARRPGLGRLMSSAGQRPGVRAAGRAAGGRGPRARGRRAGPVRDRPARAGQAAHHGQRGRSGGRRWASTRSSAAAPTRTPRRCTAGCCSRTRGCSGSRSRWTASGDIYLVGRVPLARAGQRRPRPAPGLGPACVRRIVQHDPAPGLRDRDPPRVGLAGVARGVAGEPGGLPRPAPGRLTRPPSDSADSPQRVRLSTYLPGGSDRLAENLGGLGGGARRSARAGEGPRLGQVLPAMTYTLILLRHGESEWNALNLFTGWVDVDLTAKGEAEAVNGGQMLPSRICCPTSRTPPCRSAPSGPRSWRWRTASATGSRCVELAAQRAALRRAAGQGQEGDAAEVRRGEVHRVAALVRRPAAADRSRGPARPDPRPPLRRPGAGDPACRGVPQGRRHPDAALLVRRDRPRPARWDAPCWWAPTATRCAAWSSTSRG